MARKFEIRATGKYAWNPERCEEIVIIAAYGEIVRFLTPREWLQRDFEHHFYEKGAGVGFHLLKGINEVRKRKNLQPIVLKETDCSDYARMNQGWERGKLRQALRDEFDEANVESRAKMVENARLETDRLPSPHFNLDEYKARQEIIDSSNRASRDEVVRRLAATTIQQQKATAGNRLARIKKMFSLASPGDPELHRELAAILSPDEALELAGEVDSAEIRSVLIRHSLSGMTAA
jgi:hypothetical protein